MAKSAILNLNWQERTLKVIVERDFIDKIEKDTVWIEFNKERLYLFNIVTQELL